MNKKEFIVDEVILNKITQDLKIMKSLRSIAFRKDIKPAINRTLYINAFNEFTGTVRRMGLLVKTNTVVNPTFNRIYYVAKQNLDVMQGCGYTIASIEDAIGYMNSLTHDVKQTFN